LSDSLLEAKGLRKSYGKKLAVDGVDFSMGTGEVVGLLGPNGAGKTTVFYMLAGFLKPSAGTVELDGIALNGLPMYRRARLGISYLPQEASIFRKLSVENNIMAVLEAQAGMDESARRARTAELLQEFGISAIAKQPGYTPVGGRAPSHRDSQGFGHTA
jgi:ABC-type (unclassified) transport system, ATPase component